MATEGLPTTAMKNVEAIALVEQELHGRRSRVERTGEIVARFFGSLRFVAAHALFIAVWIPGNSGLFPLRPFDPYPFPFLSLIVGVEFIFLTTFVLMNQRDQSRRQEHWAHLNLQLSMLTEHEVTMNLQMLQRLCRRFGLGDTAVDEEVEELAKATPVETLVKAIEQSRDESDAAQPSSVGGESR